LFSFEYPEKTLSELSSYKDKPVLIHFGYLFKVNVNGKLYLSEESNEIEMLKQKYSIKLED